MRLTLAALIAALALAAFAPLAGAIPPAHDSVAGPSPTPVVVAGGSSSNDDGGLATGWIVALCGGAAVAGVAAGFAGARVRDAAHPA